MDELLKIGLTKNIIKLLPNRFRYRMTRLLYDYNSTSNKGVNLVVNYDDNLKFLLNTKEFIGWNIFFHKYYEYETNTVLKNYIKKDFYVIEAGANNGSETIIIGNILKSGRGKIFAFEPAPLPFKVLLINITLNELQQVIQPYDLLLGEEESYVNFFLASDSDANQGKSSKYKFNESSQKITKRQTTLDKFIEEQNIEKVDFLKMDIQGSELDLMEGGINTLLKYHPIIFTEASNSELNRRGKSILDLYNKLISMDYDVFRITKNGLSLISKFDQVKDGNWLAKAKLS